jgi:hypothetical protein
MRTFISVLVLALAATASAAPPIKGVALGLYPGGPDDPSPALAEIASTGATTVSLVVSWRQHDVKSVPIEPTDNVTVPDEQVRKVIRAAHAAKLQVFLFPIIEVEIRHPLEWRGTIAPPDVQEWWKNYETFIMHYAALAAEENVELFAVGSELVSTETWQERWYHLISKVKAKYKGKLVYSANWDHYEPVSFWDRVDYVGVTAYNELTKKENATEAELTAGWDDIRKKLVAFSTKVKRPLIITEIGYTSQVGASLHPWDYTLRAKVDLEEQRKCYQAFVNAWKDEPQLGGVFWWNWYGQGGPEDITYTPRGKPAEIVLRAWYGGVAR